MTSDSTYIDLVPIELTPVKGPGEDQAELLTFLRKRNRVRLGAPRVSDYLADLRATAETVPEDLIELLSAGYAIRRIRPTLTLLPDQGCIFTDVDFSIELIGNEPTGQQSQEKPLAYEVRPAEIVESIPFTHSEKTTQELSGEAGTAAGKLIAKVAKENAVEDKGSYSLRRVYSYGANFYEAGWRFRASTTVALEGDMTGLEVIVQVPPRSTLSGRFRIAAEMAVETAPDRWLTRSFGPRRGDPALDVVYPLSR